MPSKAIFTESSIGGGPRTREKRNAYTLNIIKFLRGLKKNVINNLNINYKQKYLPETSPETEKKSILYKFPKIKFILGSWSKEFWGYKKEHGKKLDDSRTYDRSWNHGEKSNYLDFL